MTASVIGSQTGKVIPLHPGPLPAALRKDPTGCGWGRLSEREPEKPPIFPLLYHAHHSTSPAAPTTNPLRRPRTLRFYYSILGHMFF